jgi:hypothetical protein
MVVTQRLPPNVQTAVVWWCVHTNRESCDASHSLSSESDQYDNNNSMMEETMFNWKTRECVQEIFALTFAVGTLLALAAVIPA